SAYPSREAIARAGVGNSIANGFGFEHECKPIPPGEKPRQRHLADTAISIVGIDNLDTVAGEIDQGDDMSAGSRIEFTEADGGTQAMLNRIAEDLLISLARILDAVTDVAGGKRRL